MIKTENLEKLKKCFEYNIDTYFTREKLTDSKTLKNFYEGVRQGFKLSLEMLKLYED